jgi:hypothetical protein
MAGVTLPASMSSLRTIRSLWLGEQMNAPSRWPHERRQHQRADLAIGATEHPGHGHRCCLLEAEVRRVGHQPVLASAGVLGEGAHGAAEDLVARLEGRDVLADRGNNTGHVGPWDVVLGRRTPWSGCWVPPSPWPTTVASSR